MHLVRLIEKLGDDVCAVRWGMAERRIAGWRRLEAHPTRKTALKLMELEKEELKTLEDIFGPVPPKEPEPPHPLRRKTDKVAKKKAKV